MPKNKNKRRTPTGKSNGRPRKKTQNPRPNAGRKSAQCGETMSRATHYRAAQKIRALVRGDSELLRKALSSLGAENGVNVTPKRAVEKVSAANHDPQRHSPETAAAFYLNHNYSKKKYCGLVTDSRDKGAKTYPCYEKVQSAIIECRPDGITADDLGASVPLQNMMNTSSERTIEEVAPNWPQSALLNVKMEGTFGSDSSGNRLNPQQRYTNNPGEESMKAEQSLFVTSINIIRVTAESPNGTKYEWRHPKPQSRRVVRPLRIRYEKENDENIRKEYDRVSDEVKKLEPHRFTLSNGKNVVVRFDVRSTLFDGKCVNAITGNKNTKKCSICHRTTAQFGNVDDDFEPVDENVFNFGLGLLHVVIKIFEYLLHLAYRKKFKMWTITGANRQPFEEEMTKYESRMWDMMRVRVDQVLMGRGTSNTGKIALKCLMEPEKLAQTLEIDPTLVKTFSDSIRLFRSKQELDYDALEIHLRAEHRRHYEIYPWAQLSPTAHKFLWHSCEIARRFPLPMIYYSEDGSEASHKHYRRDTVEHARQTDRTSRVTDTFNRGIDMSDPKFALLELNKPAKEKKKKYKFTLEMKKYLIHSAVSECSDEEYYD